MKDSFNIIQTFYIDSYSAQGAKEVFLTSIDLYVKTKPNTVSNLSGAPSPGIVVFVCPVENGIPKPDIRMSEFSRMTFEQINAFGDASAETKFVFPGLVNLKTNEYYGIVIKLEDEGYKFWTNVQGENLLGTNTKSSGSNQANDGKYFEATNTDSLRSLADRDLKFAANIAKFKSNTETIELVNKPYEFLSFTNIDGQFVPGERVFQIETEATGNVAITQNSDAIEGNGTNFESILRGDYIVIKSNDLYDVMMIDLVANQTSMDSTEPARFTNAAAKYFPAAVGEIAKADVLNNKIVLRNSSANSSLSFDVGATIRGEYSGASAVISDIGEFKVDIIKPFIDIGVLGSSTVDLTYRVVENANGNFLVSNSYSTLSSNVQVPLNSANSYILSRSQEVTEDDIANTRSLSIVADINAIVPRSNAYETPYIDVRNTIVKLGQSKLSASVEVDGLDTEVGRYGTAASKYVSNKVTLATGRYAEDLNVYLNAYRPTGTSISVYARIYNSVDQDAFDDKPWTPLELAENALVFSSDINDLVEYTYTLPYYPEVKERAPGSYISSVGNTVIEAQEVNPSTVFTAGDVVKIQNTIFERNNFVAKVVSANTTALVINNPIPDVNVAGAGAAIDILKYDTAFKNARNDGILRYYNSAGAFIDTFNVVQIKIVFLSENNLSPEVDTVQFVCLSI